MKLQGKRRVPGGKKALAKLFKKPVKNAAAIADFVKENDWICLLYTSDAADE